MEPSKCDLYGDLRPQYRDSTVTVLVDGEEVVLKVCQEHFEFFKTFDSDYYKIGRAFTGEVEVRPVAVNPITPPTPKPPAVVVIPPGIYDYYGGSSINDWPHEGGTDPYYDTSSYFNMVPQSIDPSLGDMVDIIDVDNGGRQYQALRINRTGLYLLSLTVAASLNPNFEGTAWYVFMNGYNESDNSSMQMRVSDEVPVPIVNYYTAKSQDLFTTLTEGTILTPFVLVYNAQVPLTDGEFDVYIQLDPLILDVE